jgi:hypothetical protein
LMHADHDGLYALRCVLYGSALWLHGIRESYAARCMVFVACRFHAARKGRAVRAAKIRNGGTPSGSCCRLRLAGARCRGMLLVVRSTVTGRWSKRWTSTRHPRKRRARGGMRRG